MIIYTAIYGGFDKLIEQPDIGVKYVCYTDDPNLTSDCWEIRYEPLPYDSVMSAKYWKLIPPFDESIWIDGNMEITCPNFVDELCYFADEGICFYPHPFRQNIQAEIKVLIDSGRAEDSEHQYNMYIKEGFVDNKLLCGGLIVRFGKYLTFGKAWLDEVVRWTNRDQVSLTYALWKTQTSASIIKRDMYAGTPHFVYPHYSTTDRSRRALQLYASKRAKAFAKLYVWRRDKQCAYEKEVLLRLLEYMR